MGTKFEVFSHDLHTDIISENDDHKNVIVSTLSTLLEPSSFSFTLGWELRHPMWIKMTAFYENTHV